MGINKYNRLKTATVVVVLFVIGALLNIPYSRELKRLKIEAGDLEVKLSASVLTDIIQTIPYSILIGVILAFVGLWVASKAKLGAPVIEGLINGNSKVSRKAILYNMFLAAVTAVLLLLAFEVQKEFFPVEGKLARPSKPFYAIVAFSVGITEEIIFRFGLMSLIVATIVFIKGKSSPTKGIIWISIIITAIFFGLMHLPLSKNFTNLTAFSVGITMIGNLITGSLFGWMYWKRGLLVAIIAHITWDLVFHVLGSPYM